MSLSISELRLVKYWLPIVSLLIGFALSFLVFERVETNEKTKQLNELQVNASVQLQRFENSLELHFEIFQTIADFYRAAVSVEREEFDVYVDRLLKKNHGFASIYWLPRIPRSQLDNFEQITRIDFDPEFKVIDIDEKNMQIAADERKEYFPIFYAASLSENKRKIGTDMSNAEISKKLIVKSKQSEQFSYQFYQNDEKLFLFGLMPIYPHWSLTAKPEKRKDSLLGFIATDIDVTLIWQEITQKKVVNLKLVSGSESWLLLADEGDLNQRKIYANRMQIGNSFWLVSTFDNPLASEVKITSLSVPYLVFGLIITLILSGYLFVVVNQKNLVESQVVERTKELAAQTVELEAHRQFEELIANISGDFVRVKTDNVDCEIRRALKRLGEFIRTDRCAVYKNDGKKLILSHEWYSDSSHAIIDDFQSLPIGKYPWVELCMSTEHAVVIDQLSDLPPEAKAEKNELLRNSVKSIAMFPLISENKIYGHVAFTHITKSHKWTEVERSLLPLVGELFCITLVRAENVKKRLLAELELVETNKQLKKMARHDSLTGLANRRYLNEVLEKEIQLSRRNNMSLSILIFDIDYFKLYNDSYGHVLGDQCLVEFAEVIKASFKREVDLTARFGGEEFVVVLPNTDEKGAIIATKKFQKNLSDKAIPHRSSKVSEHLTASIGLLTLVDIGQELSLSRVVEMADIALYHAKQNGRNQVARFKDVQEISHSPSSAAT